jgi:Ca2+:H+ antiporter
LRILSILLVLMPVGIVASALDGPSTLIFLCAAGALIPVSGFIGKATEDVALHSGPRIGGLLNVTMGNAAELIITLVALNQGLTELVRASIAGSMLGNTLLVLGASLLVGGLRNGRQHFDAHVAGISATMLALAIVALSLEALFSTGPHAIKESREDALSASLAVVLLVLYGLYVLYTVFLHKPGEPAAPAIGEEDAAGAWGLRTSVAVLGASTAAAVVMSELLVGAVEDVVDAWGITELFVGVMLVPVIGNAAEHWSAVVSAYRGHMDLSLGISIGSSLQIALFTAPVLVLAGFLLGNHLQLLFNQYELVALGGAAVIAALISLDGESNWVEGAQLLGVYTIFGLGFFFLS